MRYSIGKVVDFGDLTGMEIQEAKKPFHGFGIAGFRHPGIGVLCGFTGIGKSYFALQSALRVASGADGDAPRKVLWLNMNDLPDEIGKRADWITERLELGDAQKEALRKNFVLADFSQDEKDAFLDESPARNIFMEQFNGLVRDARPDVAVIDDLCLFLSYGEKRQERELFGLKRAAEMHDMSILLINQIDGRKIGERREDPDYPAAMQGTPDFYGKADFVACLRENGDGALRYFVAKAANPEDIVNSRLRKDEHGVFMPAKSSAA